MKQLWNIADLIDLHYFFQEDEDVRRRDGEAVLAKRDRIIYLAKIEPKLGKVDTIPPRILVRKWLTIRQLQYRRERGREGMLLPGTVWRELTLLWQGLFFFLGLFSGLGLAGSLLLYSGEAPLNVSVYFGVFVVVQLLVFGVQGVMLGYRRARRIPMESTVVYVLVGRLLMRGLDAIRRRLQRKMTASRRLDLAALVGGVRQRKELAALLIWPAFMLVQLGGIGFNLGVVGATLAKVAFSDVAFAWQSSLQVSAGFVADLVRWIALPWSWAVPQGYPTLEQVQGSQVVLKEGMAHLATGDLVAWWPFLCSAVVVYGLLPRCLLLVLGGVQQRRALDQLHFATLDIRPLLQRMTGPRLDTGGEQTTVPTDPSPPVNELPPESDRLCLQPMERAGKEGTLCCLLVPDELFEECPRATLRDLLAAVGWTDRVEWVRYGVPGTSEEESLAPLASAAAQGVLAGVLLLQEAWQPPLKETERFVGELRRLAGERVPVTILLVGRPAPNTVLTPVDPESLRIWRQKMQALGDPALEVRSLVQP